MSEPSLNILGIHRLVITDDLFREQFNLLYGSDLPKADQASAKVQTREQLESIVLVEILVSNPDDLFSVENFGQPGSDQVAYLESFLSDDGKEVISRFTRPEESVYRVVFYLHFFDPSKPITTSYGDLRPPPIYPMPDRLWELVPYEPVD